MEAIKWVDKTIFIGDNLPIMRGMNSYSVDLTYLFNTVQTEKKNGDVDAD